MPTSPPASASSSRRFRACRLRMPGSTASESPPSFVASSRTVANSAAAGQCSANEPSSPKTPTIGPCTASARRRRRSARRARRFASCCVRHVGGSPTRSGRLLTACAAVTDSCGSRPERSRRRSPALSLPAERYTTPQPQKQQSSCTVRGRLVLWNACRLRFAADTSLSGHFRTESRRLRGGQTAFHGATRRGRELGSVQIKGLVPRLLSPLQPRAPR